MSSAASTPDRQRVFPIYARFAYPGNGYQGDRDQAAAHLTPGKVYLIDHVDVGRSHTTIYLHDFRDIGFNSVLFAAAWYDDEDEDEPEEGAAGGEPGGE